MAQTIHRKEKDLNIFDGYDDLQIIDNDHRISWNGIENGYSFLGVNKTHHAPTVSITASETYEEPRKNKRASGLQSLLGRRRISREVRLELNLDGAKALRDLLDEIIEIEGEQG